MSFDKLKEYLENIHAEHGVPACDCIVMQNGQEVFRHVVGYADAEHTRPAGKEDLYFVYSASKVITCTAVMQLVEKNKLSLEDPLEKYLPEFGAMQVLEDVPQLPVFALPERAETRPANRSIRIIDLMTMTAGLSYDLKTPQLRQLIDNNPKASTREVVKAIAASPLVFEPGSHWMYSLAHDVLGAVIEAVSGMELEAYMRENIFDPLGMQDVFVRIPQKDRPRISALYALEKDGGLREMEKENSFLLTEKYVSGGAGFACSVNSYIKFANALCNGGVGANKARILSAESIDEMRKNRLYGQTLEDFKKGGKKGYGYGLGVRTLIDKDASKGPVGEFGWDGAAGAYTLIDPENRLCVFYAQHIWFCMEAYTSFHPAIRDLVYEALS